MSNKTFKSEYALYGKKERKKCKNHYGLGEVD